MSHLEFQEVITLRNNFLLETQRSLGLLLGRDFTGYLGCMDSGSSLWYCGIALLDSTIGTQWRVSWKHDGHPPAMWEFCAS
jgi:hypothetical protein